MKYTLFLQESMWKRQDRETSHHERHGVLFHDCGWVIVMGKGVRFEIGKS